MAEQFDIKHVVPRDEGWGVIDAKGLRASKVFLSKGEAIEFAKELAIRHKVCMVIHDEEGKFEKFECKPEIRDQHVVQKGDNWAVVEENGKYISKTFKRKGAAMAHAYQLAVDHDVCMLVHDENGKFQSVSCGHDNTPGILELIRMKLKI